MSPLAHTTGFGLDEVIVFGTVVASYVVYRFARGPRPEDGPPPTDPAQARRGTRPKP